MPRQGAGWGARGPWCPDRGPGTEAVPLAVRERVGDALAAGAVPRDGRQGRGLRQPREGRAARAGGLRCALPPGAGAERPGGESQARGGGPAALILPPPTDGAPLQVQEGRVAQAAVQAAPPRRGRLLPHDAALQPAQVCAPLGVPSFPPGRPAPCCLHRYGASCMPHEPPCGPPAKSRAPYPGVPSPHVPKGCSLGTPLSQAPGLQHVPGSLQAVVDLVGGARLRGQDD